jgi:hypothetical protein
MDMSPFDMRRGHLILFGDEPLFAPSLYCTARIFEAKKRARLYTELNQFVTRKWGLDSLGAGNKPFPYLDSMGGTWDGGRSCLSLTTGDAAL